MSDLAEIYSLLRKQGEALSGISATLSGMKENQDKDQSRVEKIETRLRKVEGRQHWYAGITAAASTALTWFISHKTGT